MSEYVANVCRDALRAARYGFELVVATRKPIHTWKKSGAPKFVDFATPQDQIEAELGPDALALEAPLADVKRLLFVLSELLSPYRFIVDAVSVQPADTRRS
jgi:hypothetical protein